jgi:hypothetical protein
MNFDLSGLIDIHIHTKPDVQPRLLDDLQAASLARQAGMRAILIKSHAAPTAGRAAITEKAVGGIRVCGGLVLNSTVGGLNPDAVEAAAGMGARVIWMPTHSARSMFRRAGLTGGITILDEKEKVLPVAGVILECIRQADIVLATGHLSVRESIALVRTAKAMGLRKIVVTHPESALVRMPAEVQEALRGPGVYFDRCFVDTLPSMNCATSVEEIGRHIRRVGVESTLLSTDLGQATNPSPAEGMAAYLSSLTAVGFSEKEISRMAGENPSVLLDL